MKKIIEILKNPITQKDWGKKIVIGGLLGIPASNLIQRFIAQRGLVWFGVSPGLLLWILVGIVLGIFIEGYLLLYLKKVVSSDGDLPEWVDFGDIFVKGISVVLIGIAYMIVPCILIKIGDMLLITDAFVMFGSAVSWIGKILAIVTIFLFPLIFCEFAKKENLKSALALNPILEKLKPITKEYSLNWLIIVGLGVVVSFIISLLRLVNLDFLLQSFFIFYVYLIFIDLFGNAYKKG